MKFRALAACCERVASTTKRLEKIQYLATFLQQLNEDEIAPAVLLITGQIFPESSSTTLDVSWNTVQKAREKHQETLIDQELTITDVSEYFRKIARTSQRKRKEQIVASLLSQASVLEQTTS